MFKKVSIIIPCYNCSKYIKETLNSIDRQYYKNIEVLCINDGSTDDTIQVIHKYQQKSSLDILVYNQENAGVSKARNTGISKASGEYILFLDSDDIISSSMISSLVSSLSNNCDVSYCLITRHLNELDNFTSIRSDNFLLQDRTDLLNSLLYRMGEISFTCFLYTKSILQEFNIRFDENTKYFEDREFNWKYLCHCRKGAFISRRMYGYRENETSATKSPDLARITDSLLACYRVKDYVGKYEPEYVEKINKYLIPRVSWSILKDYAIFGNLQLMRKADHDFSFKSKISYLLKDKNKLVRISSLLYLLNPLLFIIAIKLGKKIFK